MWVHFIMTIRSQSSHIASKRALGNFLIFILQSGGGSNDIMELTEFSTQLDMLIEKAGFKGKVHVCADGGTMQDGSVISKLYL